MLAAHEVGHVLHAWLSGGRGIHVEFPLVGFSRTDVASNPRPMFVAIGGVVWGSLLPCALLLTLRCLRWRGLAIARFFSGLCLLANGAYLLSAAFDPVGDVEDLITLGAAKWLLTLVGAGGIFGGLVLWNGLWSSMRSPLPR